MGHNQLKVFQIDTFNLLRVLFAVQSVKKYSIQTEEALRLLLIPMTSQFQYGHPNSHLRYLQTP